MDHEIHNKELIRRTAEEFLRSTDASDAKLALNVLRSASELANLLRFAQRQYQWILAEGVEGVLSIMVHHGQEEAATAYAMALNAYVDADFDRARAMDSLRRTAYSVRGIRIMRESPTVRTALQEAVLHPEYGKGFVYSHTDPNNMLWIVEWAWYDALPIHKQAYVTIYRPGFNNVVNFVMHGDELSQDIVDEFIADWLDGTTSDDLMIGGEPS